MRYLAPFALLTVACAHNSSLAPRNATGQRGFSLEQGQWSDFSQPHRVCITGQDDDLGRNLTGSIVRAVRARQPGFQNDCAKPFTGIRVEYALGFHGTCTDCEPPHRGPRLSLGFLSVDLGHTSSARAFWMDTQGVTADELAADFAEDLLVFLDNPLGARRQDGTAAVLSAVGAEPTQSDWDWLTEHRAAAFDALMPMTSARAHVVTYRSYRSLYHDVPERYFSIQQRLSIPQGLVLEAVLVAPSGLSIQQQLLNFHMAEPAASLESLLIRVQVKRVTLEASTCPAIRKQLDGLARLRFTVPDMDIIILHPELHHVVVDAGGGTVDAVLQQDEHPLVKWSLETLQALQRCR